MAKTLISDPTCAPKTFFMGFTSTSIYIALSYHLMQFKGKPINRTWENGKGPNFGADFGLFDPNLDPKNFFCEFYLY